MATNNTVEYPFDPEGTAASNLITGEIQVLDPPNYMDFYFIIPRAAPFFAESLELVLLDTARVLVRGVDYVPSYRFNDASIQCAADIYGAITIYNKDLAGAVRMRYQTLGGAWTIDEVKILELLSNAVTDPRITTWEQVVEMPERFPPINHDWNLVDMVGMSETVDALYAIVDAIAESSDAALPAHLADMNNPHQTTKGQVGLGNVDDFATATVAEARAGTVTNKFMTPALVREALNAQLLTGLDAHIENHDNPHQTTASQVGLGNVQNYAVATTAEAQAGLVSNKYMTPELVRLAIETLSSAEFNAHVNDTDNPHQTDKIQVGLSNVQNYGIATQAEAEAGVSNVKYMTPALVAAAISTLSDAGAVQTALDEHIGDNDNPHGTTAAQVGAYSIEDTDQLLELKLDANAQAVDSDKLGGLTLDELRVQIDTAIVFEPSFGNDPTWTELCYWDATGSVQPSETVDLVFEAVGGDVVGGGDRQQFVVSLSLSKLAEMRVDQTQGVPSRCQFAALNNGEKIAVYMFCPANREAISIRLKSNPGVQPGTEVLTEAPVGLYYSSRVRYLTRQPQDDGAFGDLRFGTSTYPAVPDVGQIVEYLNIVDTEQGETDDDLDAIASNLSDDLVGFRPKSVFDNRVLTTVDTWRFDPVEEVLVSHVDADAENLSSLDSLNSRLPVGDFSLEVELASTNASAGNALGLTIAEIQLGGRSYALQVLRSPGQLVVDAQYGMLPGGDGYGLFTVGLNLLQHNAVVLAATSGDGLIWGDGVIAADRDLDAQPYDPGVSGGWNGAGAVRLRITREDNIITIETTNHDSTVYLTGDAVIELDLEDVSTLVSFSNRHTTWGLLNYRQPDASYKFLNRPDALLPYAVLSKTLEGVDESKLYRHNGTEWVESDLNRSNPLVRPGRMVFSEWNGRMAHWRRDGSIRMLYVEAFTSANNVALTE